MSDKSSHISKVGITLWDVIASIFFLGVFFIPFNAYDGPDFLGELQNEASVIFFLAAFLMLVVSVIITRKIFIPYKNFLFQLVLALFVWFIIATLLNFYNVSQYFFKNTSGIERFFRQYLSLLISGFFFFLVYYNVFRRQEPLALFFRLRRVLFYSFAFVCAYTFLEILIVKFKIVALFPLLKVFDYFPFTAVTLDVHLNRISGVTFEPPALASYLFTIAGWMFSYMITGKGIQKYLPGVLVVILAFFSGSRAGLIIMMIQVLFFFILLVKKRSYHQTLIRILAAGMFLGVVIGIVKGKEIATYVVEKITSFGVDEGTHKISNMSRFGLQYAMFQTFQDYPVSGVGYGQQTYVAKEHYPKWATENNWEFRLKYLNENDPRFPPGYNVYLRVLAESGIIGFVIFASLLFLILYTCFALMRKKSKYQIVIFAITISMFGFYMNWLKMDSFRMFGFWINLALLIKVMDNTKFSLRKGKGIKFVRRPIDKDKNIENDE